MSIGLTTFFSLKGGVGKSSLASAICMELHDDDEKVLFITNDAISPLEKILGEDKVLKIGQNDSFPELNTEDDVIIDLGGFVDDRAITILKNSKQIVLPTLGSFLSLSGLISTLQEVEPFNKEITIVLNRIEKKEVEKIIEFIRSDYSYPIFKVKSSKCFENLHYQNKSISQMMREEPLRRRSYKEVHAQIQELIQHLKGE
jgi:cellulose biosynthesis protein BcsQ